MAEAHQLQSFLLEIGTEDLPARFIPSATRQLGENTARLLKENYIQHTDIKTYGTPRRITVIGEGIPLMQDDRTREVFGPSRKAAFDDKGNPSKAALGFARSQGIPVESLVIKPKGKGEYLVAVIDEQGVPVKQLLPEIFKKVVLSLHLPKAMRWGTGNIRFARPIRWFMALLNNETISFEIDGIQSGNETRGHRFLSPAIFQIKEIPSYKKLLAHNCVIVDPEDRQKMIMSRMEELLSDVGESPVEDSELLQTVSNLVEYPVPVLGSFPEEYLDLPRELLITVMKGHQKYFAAEDRDGRITNHFVVVSNTSEENAETVKVGAERVIKARFEDARFYFKEDRKKPLAERVDELRKVTFQERLGTLHDKTERIAKLAGSIADTVLPSSRERASRAALLAKTDLITGAVREFPELQGVMGRYYALNDGENREVAFAIEEQYLPAHSGGRLPQTDLGSLLSIADKADNIAAFFSIGLIPTGSEDPFALRRQALGITAILLGKTFDISLRELFRKATEPFSEQEGHKRVMKEILSFFEARLETVLSDQGYPSDLIQSVLPLSADVYLHKIRPRIDALGQFTRGNASNDFLAAIKRVYNIIPKLPERDTLRFSDDLLREEQEIQLKSTIDKLSGGIDAFLAEDNYSGAIELLASSADSTNAFFDNILVMDKEDDIRSNRLSLLTELWNAAAKVADFSKFSVSQEE